MIDIDPTQDYYAYLGVPVDANRDEIHQAYRIAARRYHPDSVTGDVARFRAVQSAWEVLGDSDYRKAYDSQRTSRGLQVYAAVTLDVQQTATELLPLEGEQMLYATLAVIPSAVSMQHRRTLNIVLVIDRSTSMTGTRMRQVKLAANDMLSMLQPEDFVSLVTYSDRAEVVAPSMPARNTLALRSAIASITPGGGTEIYQGLAAGVKEVITHYSKEAVNHIILMTDGRTYGDEEQALATARQLGERGIGLTTFGIGEDWNDRFLDELAHLTGRSAVYISKPGMVRDVLREQVKEMTRLVVKNARLTVNVAPYVQIRHVYRASPHMQTVNLDEDSSAYVGGVTVGEQIVFAVEFVVSQPDSGEHRIARVDLMADDVVSSRPISIHRDLKVLFTESPVATQPSARILNILSRLNVYQLQENAWRSYERGDKVIATQMLQSAATRLFDLGYEDLGKAAMLEVGRLARGTDPSEKGRKEIRYGTRALEMPGV